MSVVTKSEAYLQMENNMPLEELRNQIRVATRFYPYLNPAKPPFTMREIVTMALVSHDEPLKEAQIVSWIRDQFAYYRHPDPSLQHPTPLQIHSADEVRLLRPVSEAMHAFEIPIELADTRSGNPHTYRYTAAAPHEVAIYLQRALGTERNGVFRFLDLPTDLRWMIYELVFAFPKSGIGIYRGHPSFAKTEAKWSFKVLYDFSKPFSFHSWQYRQHENLNIRPLPEIFGLFGVSKQVRNESLPQFYALNTFYIGYSMELESTLAQIPQAHRQQMRQLACIFGSVGRTHWQWGFKQISALSGLRKLYIEINEEICFKGFRRFRPENQRILDYLLIEGLDEMRVGEVRFEGNCTELASYLKPIMEGRESLRERLEEHLNRETDLLESSQSSDEVKVPDVKQTKQLKTWKGRIFSFILMRKRNKIGKEVDNPKR